VNCEIGDAECMLDPADPGNGVVDSEAVKVVTSAVAAPGASFRSANRRSTSKDEPVEGRTDGIAAPHDPPRRGSSR
jgi:hypothetical protein